MRAFVKLRELMISHKDLAQKIDELEQKFNQHDENFVIVFKAIIDLFFIKNFVVVNIRSFSREEKVLILATSTFLFWKRPIKNY